jgi:predicted dithiol-disulfide oxidoreductase (DUF899 family)
MTDHRIATREEWDAAREKLLIREKEHTRLGDELAQERRDLPWLPVDEDYRFDTEDGEKTLAELFDGRSQLLIYHFMFGPSYEAGDPVNSSIADAVDAVLPHLHARDVTFVFVSQAPIEKLQAYRRRMGWSLPWVSSAPSGFNFDLGFSHTEEEGREVVEEMMKGGLPPIVDHNARSAGTDPAGYITESPGFSAFVLEDGAVYQTYTTTWRGLEFVMTYYPILDHAPKGRGEDEGDWQLWLRRHDEYGSGDSVVS